MITSDNAFVSEPRDFSLVLGGPLYQILRRSHLAGDGMDLVQRRVIAMAAVAWVPLLLLSRSAVPVLARRTSTNP